MEHGTYAAGDERVIKDIMYCAGFVRGYAGGKGSQRRVLFFLREFGPMTQRALLEEMGVRASSLSELLSKLEVKGYILKEKSETDKRNYNVSITPEGRQALEELNIQHKAAMNELLSALEPEERKQLSVLLCKLREQWSAREDAPVRRCGKKAYRPDDRD